MGKEDIFADLDDSDGDFAARPALDGFDDFDDASSKGVARLDTAKTILLTQIMEKDQVRKTYDAAKITEMAESLKKEQITPISVWWSEDDQKYVVFVGHCRFRGALEAGLPSLMCIVREEPSEVDRVELQLEENLQRTDLNPVDEARAFEKLMALKSCTSPRQLAKHVSSSASKIQRSLRLLQLPADILKDVENGTLTKSILREIQAVKGDNAEAEQRALIEEYKKTGSHAAIAGKVKAKANGKKPAAAKKSKTATINGIKLTAACKKATKAEIAAALRAWADDLESDGRGRRAA